ncbi:hypothetical protein [Skermania sp. ID1734]|uniref:hypothetical protein n=1 Tax=Skermania sp. ID1734 TaxID=2597516 RepID=UPI00163DDA19|nr:hypothetical protein [Skermania sp. ID1734]
MPLSVAATGVLTSFALLPAAPASADNVTCAPAPGATSYLLCGSSYVWTPVGSSADKFPHLKPAAHVQAVADGTVLRDRPALAGDVVSGPANEFVPIGYLADLVAVGGDGVTVSTCTSQFWTLMQDATGMLGWAPQAAFQPACQAGQP